MRRPSVLPCTIHIVRHWLVQTFPLDSLFCMIISSMSYRQQKPTDLGRTGGWGNPGRFIICILFIYSPDTQTGCIVNVWNTSLKIDHMPFFAYGFHFFPGELRSGQGRHRPFEANSCRDHTSPERKSEIALAAPARCLLVLLTLSMGAVVTKICMLHVD